MEHTWPIPPRLIIVASSIHKHHSLMLFFYALSHQLPRETISERARAPFITTRAASLAGGPYAAMPSPTFNQGCLGAPEFEPSCRDILPLNIIEGIIPYMSVRLKLDLKSVVHTVTRFIKLLKVVVPIENHHPLGRAIPIHKLYHQQNLNHDSHIIIKLEI